MKMKRGGGKRLFPVYVGVACALVLAVAGILLWQPWGDTSRGPAGDDAALPVSDVEAEDARGETTGSDDAATLEEEIAYTDGGSGTREERAEYIDLDPHIDELDPATEYDAEAYIHASKAFAFIGTVVSTEAVAADRNRFETPMALTVAVDRVYTGDVFAEGDTVSMFFPISRFVRDDGSVTQCGPRMEAGRSYVFFCDLPEDALVQSWLDDRYPGSPGLADGFDLVVSWDAYCFPIEEGLICAWKGMGWDGNPSAEKDGDFNESLFFDTLGNITVRPPDAVYYTEEDFARAIEAVKATGPLGIASMGRR